MQPRRKRIAPILAAFIAIFFAVWHQRANAPKPATTAPPVVTSSTPAPAPAPAPATHVETRATTSPLDAIAADERAEVEKVIALIEKGGPFPHAKDGTVFSNRENRLPQQPRGYYREYTVETPGASNRGARRIVRGRNGETYYTNDHYESFIRIDT